VDDDFCYGANRFGSAYMGAAIRETAMRVRIEDVGAGQHPSERVVKIETIDGPQQLVVDKRSIENQSLDVGYPVGQSNGHLLVELPRETFRGAWRVWIDNKVLID
jgi:hypothetical protein